MPLLELNNVSKVYQRRRRLTVMPGKSHHSEHINAVCDVSMIMDQHQAIGIIGESGAGKTTLGMLISGLIHPSSGSIKLDNKEIHRTGRKELAKKLQMIWQDVTGSLDPRIRVGASIEEPLKVQKTPEGIYSKELVNSLLCEVGLNENLLSRYPNELSGGELQRVVIARALATDPELLICDEPASALDVRIKVQIAELLMKLRVERKLSYLIIAHDLTLVRKITKDVIVMYAGTIIEKGPTLEVLNKPVHPYTKLLVASDPVNWNAEFIMGDIPTEDKYWAEHGSALTGCQFYPRCNVAIERCAKFKPHLLRLKAGREAACLFPVSNSESDAESH